MDHLPILYLIKRSVDDNPKIFTKIKKQLNRDFQHLETIKPLSVGEIKKLSVEELIEFIESKTKLNFQDFFYSTKTILEKKQTLL